VSHLLTRQVILAFWLSGYIAVRGVRGLQGKASRHGARHMRPPGACRVAASELGRSDRARRGPAAPRVRLPYVRSRAYNDARPPRPAPPRLRGARGVGSACVSASRSAAVAGRRAGSAAGPRLRFAGDNAGDVCGDGADDDREILDLLCSVSRLVTVLDSCSDSSHMPPVSDASSEEPHTARYLKRSLSLRERDCATSYLWGGPPMGPGARGPRQPGFVVVTTRLC